MKKHKILLIGALIIGSLLIGLSIANAAVRPASWDVYFEVDSNSDILNAETPIMNTYNSSYTLKPAAGEDGHGPIPLYPYTELTIDSATMTMSKWYTSPYGPLLHYVENTGDRESRVIQFNDVYDTYRMVNYAYIASDQEDIADAKSVAALNNSISTLKPLLLNSSYDSISGEVNSKLQSYNVKNIVVVGGSQRFDSLFDIGDTYNIVRVGGQERNQTYDYLSICESNASKMYNVSTPPDIDDSGILFNSADIEVISQQSLIEADLKTGNFKAAADIVLSIKQGSDTNIQTGKPTTTIGYKNQSTGKMQFLIVYEVNYINGFTYGVYQYIGQNYFTSYVPPSTTGPTADVFPPSQVVAGDDVNISATGSSADATVTNLTGKINFDNYNGVNEISLGSYSQDFDENSPSIDIEFSGSVWFSSTGTFSVYSKVTDSNGGVGTSAHKPIYVIAPVPEVVIHKTGTEKENRKVTIDASNSYGGSKRYPINWPLARWNIAPEGISNMDDLKIQSHTEGSTNGTIIYDSSRGINNLSSLNGTQKFDILCKKAGKYIITCTLTNTFGMSNTSSIVVNIVPDQAPIAKFSMPTVVYRDPNNPDAQGLSQLTFPLIDDGTTANGSYSPDGDIIAKRIWLYCFDANNRKDANGNGIFDNEPWYVYDNSVWHQFTNSKVQAVGIDVDSINDGNKKNVDIVSNHVGLYEMDLIVKEEFGQDTIPQFVTAADRKTGNTFN